MPYCVRDMRETDLPALCHMLAALHNCHAAARPDQFQPLPDPLPDEEARAQLQGATCFVADSGGRAVGCCLAKQKDIPQAGPFRAHKLLKLEDLYVEPDCRGQGVATALLRAAVAHARALRLGDVELCVWAFNAPARRLYEQLGFQPKHLMLELPLEGDAHAG